MHSADLFLSPAFIKEQTQIRHRAFKAIRSFFDHQAYIEIDAPVLIPANAVEAFIDPLATKIHLPDDSRSDRLFLMTSPEIHMKRLLCCDLNKIYFLGHVFRDRELSRIHANEFMMLEWYETGVALPHLFQQCEKLFLAIFSALSEYCSASRNAELQTILEVPFDRVSVASAWDKYAQIDLLKCLQQIADGDPKALNNAVISSGEHLRENADFDDAFTHIMVKKIEPMIGQTNPCILYEWPSQTAALAKLNPENPLVAQRFEIYFAGMEIANAFEELSDPLEQKKRFEDANSLRRSIGREELPISQNFIDDLHKMAPACGIAVGIDRLLAALLNRSDLREIIPFHLQN